MFSAVNLPTEAPTELQLTPRSQEALRRLGLSTQDLFHKDRSEVQRMFTDHATGHLLEQRYRYLDQRRAQKVGQLIEARRKVVEEERRGEWSSSLQGKHTVHSSTQSQNPKSTLIEREIRLLEKIRLKQQKELEQSVQHEVQLQGIRQRNEHRLAEERERDRQHEEQLAAKHREEERLRNQRDELHRQRQQAQEEQLRIRHQDQLQKERLFRQRELEIQQQKEEQAKQLEEERRQHQEEYKKQTDRILQEQQELVLQRQQLAEERQKQRAELMQEMNAKRRQQSEQRMAEKEEKLRQARLRNEQELHRLAEDYKRKDHQSELKRLQFQQEKHLQFVENRLKIEKHNLRLKEVLQNNAMLQTKKKGEYLRKMKEVEERQQQLERIAQAEQEQHRKAEQLRQQQRLHVLQKNEQLQQELKEDIMRKLKQKEETLQRSQAARLEQIRQRQNQHLLRQFDKKDSLQRMLRIHEFEKEKLLERINGKMARADAIKHQREQLLDRRAQMKRQVDSQKRQMFEKIEKVKLGKISPQEVIESLSLQKSASTMYRSPSKPKSVHVSLHQSPQKTSKSQFPSIISESSSPKTPKQSQTLERVKSLDLKPMIKYKKDDVDLKQDLQQLIYRQNSQMLKVLQEEQNAENQREIKLIGASKQDKKKLEKINGAERAKAQARIQKISNVHSLEIRRFKQHNNLH